MYIYVLLISQPLMTSTIFRHFRHKNKHLVSTTFTLPYYIPAPQNAESLKRICAPPSVKMLFPPSQCKSSFRKFTTKSIKTYTSQNNKNMIHNLSVVPPPRPITPINTPYLKTHSNLTLKENDDD